LISDVGGFDMDDEKLRKNVERLKAIVARSYRAHEKTGCTGCDLRREILEAL